MKVFLSADIEGVAGITAPDEANPDHRDFPYFKEQMTREVKAACDGSVAAGAREIWVKDAHWHGRNIDARALPECTRLIRGWSGHPFSMMQEIDASFAAALFVGYHARAGSGGNPLSHTMSGRVVQAMRLNERPASEFLLNSYTAASVGVPVVFLSGDEALCEEARHEDERITTVATLRGVGASTVSIHPELAVRTIREAAQAALAKPFKPKPLPRNFSVEIDYKVTRDAYSRSFYPGARLVQDATLRFESDTWLEVLRMLLFCLK